MSNTTLSVIMDGMDWIIYLIAATALVAIYGFHRFMSGIERRESLGGRGVIDALEMSFPNDGADI